MQYVTKVLDHVAHMDASALTFGSIPISFIAGTDTHLSNYFSERIFRSIVFPAFECRANELIRQKFAQAHVRKDYKNWLNELADTFTTQEKLHQLMTQTDDKSNQVVKQEFSFLVDRLYQAKLPDSFFQRSEIYIQAIKDSRYDPMSSVDYLAATQAQAHNTLLKKTSNTEQICQIMDFRGDATWQVIQQLAQRQIDNLGKRVAAPREFYANLTRLESLPVEEELESLQSSFPQDLQQYLNWSRELKQHWLVGRTIDNACSQTQLALNQLSSFIIGQADAYTQNFEQTCLAAVSRQFVTDNQQIQPEIYQQIKSVSGSISDTGMQFTAETENLLASLGKLTNLSFIYHQADKVALIGEGETDFFWSVESLSRALRLYDEYKEFAKINYASTALPSVNKERHQYAAQAIALKQLQSAMTQTISAARVLQESAYVPDRNKPVNQQEAQLAGYLQNFNEASSQILKLHQVLMELGFSQTDKWLMTMANEHAFGLLEKTDQLYRRSRIYSPSDQTIWSAQQYTMAMFGIASEGQLKDYLFAQAERMDYLAANYVNPLLTFLSRTNAAATNYQLFSRWHNTLVEINKRKEHQDNANSQAELERFFNNQLLQTNQSNCFEQERAFIQPNGNNLFAISQRNIVRQARRLCKKFTSEQIEKEYANLYELFSSMLANRYPFTDSFSANTASPALIKRFIEQYPGRSSGLANRMTILVWSKRDSADQAKYQQASQFVKDLDMAIDFFNALVNLNDPDTGGIELRFEFDVIKTFARQIEHISLWQLEKANEQFTYPSTNQSNQHSLLWSPNSRLALNLDWAQNSPFIAQAINGQNAQQRLVYSGDGIWSLLNFIQKYRARRTDPHQMSDSSILLNFSAALSAKNQTGLDDAKIDNLQAYARLTLYGQDPENKQLSAIRLPTAFPKYAPKLEG